MKKIITLAFSLLLGSLNILKAEQLLGVSIHYKPLGAYKYQVTYTVYTDRYVMDKLDTTVFKPLVFKVISGSSSVINNPKLSKIDSINVGCYTDIRKNVIYHYIDTIDLNQPGYSSIKFSSDCRTYFTCRYPERYRGLKNIPASAYFTYAFINTCNNASNTSAKNFSWGMSTCCNKPFYQGMYYYDTTDFDSLVYSPTTPFNNFNSTISFSAGYSKNEPIDVYWPSGYDKLLGSNPTVNPPIGIYLDTNDGSLVYVPVLCNSEYSISREVKEFKKTGGQYKETGGVLNDFVIKIIEDKFNNPPSLYGPYSYSISAGQQICFTITSYDKQFIPPPPQKPNPPDTVRLTWNRGIPGATFTIVDPKAKLQQGKFCWTARLDQVSKVPYIFTVTARDNSCPTNASYTRAYSVLITEPVSVSKLNSPNITISPNPSTGQLHITSVNFKFNEVFLLDILGQQLAGWNFNKTETFSKDLSHLSPGVYFIKCSNGGEVYNFKWIRE